VPETLLPAKILNVDHAQRGEYQHGLVAAAGQRRGAADHTAHLKRLGRAVARQRLQRDLEAAVIKADWCVLMPRKLAGWLASTRIAFCSPVSCW